MVLSVRYASTRKQNQAFESFDRSLTLMNNETIHNELESEESENNSFRSYRHSG